ncbi:MAG: hypothetical protein HY652_13430 [Acidobacteria bacterium]|nr:hypothetical protein [Acidobacteriota bacterium]
MRVIEGQKTRLARTSHAIAYDEIHDEIVIPNPFAEAILVYRGGASGDEPPIRVIQGPHTMLEDNDELALDLKNDEIVVPLRHQILFFPRNANGDVAPKRVIGGLKTKLDMGRGIAVDPVNNILVVGNSRPRGLLVFNLSDQGDVVPRAIISGPNTGIYSTQGFTANPARKEVFCSIEARGSQETRELGNSFVGVWNYTDSGDVPPKAIIKGKDTLLIAPRGVILNPPLKEVYVIDKMQNALFAFRWPEIF